MMFIIFGVISVAAAFLVLDLVNTYWLSKREGAVPSRKSSEVLEWNWELRMADLEASPATAWGNQAVDLKPSSGEVTDRPTQSKAPSSTDSQNASL